MIGRRERLEAAAALLRAGSTVSLATTAGDGAPRVTPLFYLPGDGLRLYWFSSRASDHSRNLKRDPRAAAAVYAPAEDWRAIRGVQMRGTAAPAGGRQLREEIAAAYAARFHLGRMFESAIKRSALYVFEPEWLRYIDNSKRFGYRFELRVKSEGQARRERPL